MVRLLCLLLLCLAPAIGHAEDDDMPAGSGDAAALATVNRVIVDHQMIPAYRAFANAGGGLVGAADGYCSDPAKQPLAPLRAAFHAVSDAWQGIQNYRFGPSEVLMRASRIFFWPDPRDNVGRQLAEFLVKPDPASLEPARFAQESVAIQGLPALERLLFGDEAVAALAAGDDQAARRCGTIRAIAANLAEMGTGMVAQWTTGTPPYRQFLLQPGSDNALYRSESEATVELFKGLFLAVEMVADRKVTPALGADVTGAKPRLLEQWRSGRSLHNIIVDLQTAQTIYSIGMAPYLDSHDKALKALLDKAFAQTLATAQAIPGQLDQAVADPAARPAVETLVREAAALKALLAQRLTVALGIPLGFNALDGD